jgi:PAS domain-containing protein
MTEAQANPDSTALAELRRYKSTFDNTWTLVTILATSLAVLGWYFGLPQVDVAPIVWTLAGLAVTQLVISSHARPVQSRARLQLLVVVSQLVGTALLGAAWHLLGGLQQPLFPLLVVVPLLPAALLLDFWQRQLVTLGFLVLLLSGLLLSPDTNSFLEERYGLVIAWGHVLPGWIPRSRVAFADVNTSPAYNLMVLATLAVVGVAVSTAARAVVALCRRGSDETAALQNEVERLQRLSAQLVARSPSAAALVVPSTGRIVNASDRFRQVFDVGDVPGRFLLDVIAFAHPTVIKRLMASGGEEVQGATVRGRDAVLRVRAEVLESGASQVTALNIERCDELCWRGEVDALDEPVFAVNRRSEVVFMNRTARALFGDGAEGEAATSLFDTGTRWWDIAPLESARRVLDRGEHRYLASIRRAKIATSIGELSFVHLYERQSVRALAS